MRSRVVLIAAFVVSLSHGATAQSLGEIAKKTADDREKSKAATDAKVYDNESLRKFAPLAGTAQVPVSSDPQGKSETPAAAAVPGTTSKPLEVKDEAWWRARMTQLRASLQSAQIEYDAKVNLVIRLERVRDSVPDRGYSVAQAYAEASAEVAKARAEVHIAAGAVAAAKSAIDDAEEEARVGRVLPGWLR